MQKTKSKSRLQTFVPCPKGHGIVFEYTV